MKTWRTLLISLEVVLLSFVFLIVQLGLLINITVLNASFYISALEKTDIYTEVKDMALKLAAANREGASSFTPYLDKAMSDQWLKSQVNEAIGGVLSYVKGQKAELPVISTAGLKAKLHDLLITDGQDQADQVIQYWLPIPDDIRLSHAFSTDVFRELRQVILWFQDAFLIGVGLGGMLCIMIFLSEERKKDSGLWIFGAFTAGGTLTLITAGFLSYFLKMSTYASIPVQSLIASGFAGRTASILCYHLVGAVEVWFLILGLISMLLGGYAMVKYK